MIKVEVPREKLLTRSIRKLSGNLPNGQYHFTVPNTIEGLAFIKLLRKFAHEKVVLRGRTKNRRNKKVSSQSVPIDKSDWFTVYLYKYNFDNNNYKIANEFDLLILHNINQEMLKTELIKYLNWGTYNLYINTDTDFNGSSFKRMFRVENCNA